MHPMPPFCVPPPRDPPRAGNHRAQVHLAMARTDQGRFREAIECLEHAAAGGYLPALYVLGRMHELGKWNAVDRARAMQRYKEAAERGHVWAEKRLALG